MSASTAPGAPSTSRTPRLPWAMLAVTVLLVTTMLILSLGQEELFDTLLYGALALAQGGIGALVASRQPENRIGWILCAMGVLAGLVETWEAFGYRSFPTGDVGTWVVGWIWIVDGAAYAVVFLLFPTGHLLNARWRWVLWALAAACLVGIPGQAFNPDNSENPFVVESSVLEVAFLVGMVLLLSSIGGAIASLAVRFRRSTGIERLQLRQLMFAGAVLAPILALAVPFYYDSVALRVAVALGLLSLPVAVGLAILRYRLYDIDVVINLTLVYGSLTATLAVVYVGSVLLLQLVLSGFTEGSGLAVAASTLAVAALFRPARARIQSIVDRRFFRSRYDARKTLESFGARLRDEVDLTALSTDLESVVVETMHPAHVSLWLRDSARSVLR